MNLSSLSLQRILPYLTHFKSLLGLLAVAFALYQGCTSVPEKWTLYQTDVATNQQLQKNKDSLKQDELKLLGISRELDKVSVKLAKTKAGEAPEFLAVDVSQKVVAAAESTGNIYVSLDPQPVVQLDLDKIAPLNVNMPAPPTTPGAPPAVAPAAPAAAAPAPGGVPAPANGLSAFQYSLLVQGNFTSLSKFLYSLAQLPTLVMVSELTFEPASKAEPGAKNPLQMRVRFLIPYES